MVVNSISKDIQSINKFFKNNFSSVLIIFILLISLISARQYGYLLFHITTETLINIIAISTFLFSWNSKKILKNNYFLFLGIALLFISILGFFHTLTYKGMNIFAAINGDIPTQLWIASRYVLVISFIIAPFLISKKINYYLIFISYFIVTCFILLSIFQFKIFPQSYIDGKGLTHFKVISEYVISILFIVAGIILIFKRDKFDKEIFLLIFFSLFFNFLSDLFFTLYFSVYDTFNLLGHFFDFLAFYLIYKAIIEIGLNKPYNLIFLELKKLNNKKDEFLNIASHEIKNPLTTIKLNAELASRFLKNTPDTPSFKAIQQINIEVDKVNNLVNDLLDIGRMETGRMKYERDNFDFINLLNNIVEECKKLFPDHLIIYKQRKYKKIIKGDKERLRQVFYNIISNAIKYSKPKTKIITNIKSIPKQLIISVQDFGIGMSEKDRKNIFNKYYRTSTSEKIAKGLGLGLYISKQIINDHKGKIWVESEINKGSTFYVSLPI